MDIFYSYFQVFGKVYDKIAENRTKISIFFGLPACNLPNIDEPLDSNIVDKKIKFSSVIMLNSMAKILSPIILLIMLSSAINSALIENPGVQSFLVRNDFIDNKSNSTNHRKKTVSSQQIFSIGMIKKY